MTLDQVSILDVWSQLGGPKLRPNGHRNVYAPAFWRGSKDSNVSINVRLNCFHDWPTDAKGGVLKFVETVRECPTRDALTFWRQPFAQLRGLKFTVA
jgi:hypothetical protein